EQVQRIMKSLATELSQLQAGTYEFRRAAAATSWDIQAVILTANRLRNAVKELPDAWGIEGLARPLARDVPLLRNVYEHGDGKSTGAFEELQRGADPAALSIHPDGGLTIGTVNVQDLISDFTFIESRLLAIESGEIQV